MWVYSVTTATEGSSVSSTASAGGNTSSRRAFNDTANSESQTYVETQGSTTRSTHFRDAFNSVTEVQSADSFSFQQTDSDTVGNTTASGSDSGGVTQRTSFGYTRTTYGGTSVNSVGTTTTSSEDTTTRSRQSYASTTQTETYAGNSQVTTTVTSTRSIVTTSAGPGSITTSENFTNTTSTTVAATLTRTTYAYAPSTTLASPESLVPVSEAEPTEQAWVATVAADSAGYAVNLGSTFTKRTGTLAQETTAASIGGTGGFTTTQTLTSGTTSAVTLTTTATTSVVDTFVPAQNTYPATVTSTRTFAMLTTETISSTFASTRTATVSFNYPASRYANSTVTYRAFHSSLVPVTINASPTETVATSFHMTWFASSTANVLSANPGNFATSESGSSAGSSNTPITTTATATFADTVNTTTNTDTATTSSTTYDTTYEETTESTSYSVAGTTIDSTTDELSLTTFTQLQTTDEYTYSSTFDWTTLTEVRVEAGSFETFWGTTYTYGITGGTTADDGFGNRTISSTWSYTDFVTESYSFFSSDRSFLGPFVLGSSSFSDSSTGSAGFSSTDSISTSFTMEPETYTTTTAEPTTSTATTTVTATTTAETTTTTVATGTTNTTGPATQTFSWESSGIDGLSFTYPQLVAQSTFTATPDWTAHAFRPRNGFRDPRSLDPSHAIYSVLSITPSSIYYPYRATQDDSAGPVTPILYTQGTSYITGDTTMSVQWVESASRLNYTSQTVASTSTTGTLSFSGASAASWYSHVSTTAASAGSRIGGTPAKSQYAAAVYFPPCVRHWTVQTDGIASASDTTWIQTPSVASDTLFLGRGWGMPERTESVWSLTQQETRWSYNTALSQAASTGSTSLPVMTLSLNPNL
jgi:hypothetical protein